VSAPVVQLRVPEATLGRLDGARGEETRTAWILRLIDREFTGQTTTTAAAGPSPGALGPDEPIPGVLCMGPGCWQRDTSKFGLRRPPLCPACAAALQGEVYERPSAERARALSGKAARPGTRKAA
jgi:hypothetical protein